MNKRALQLCFSFFAASLACRAQGHAVVPQAVVPQAVVPQVVANQVVVIANPGVRAIEISRNDLRDVFTGTSSTLKSGSPVAPVILKEGHLHEEFLVQYVGKSDTAFRASWRSIVFSGQGVMPRSLDSEASVVEYVARTNGAIGYIGKATPHTGVKTLAIR